MNHSLSDFKSAYRKGYSTNHFLIALIENWRKALDHNLFTRAVLKDLPKHLSAFLIYLLTAKLHGYGLGIDIVNFLSTYLKEQKSKVSVNKIYSIFELILLGVPQSSMLDQISFSISPNGLSLR